MDTLRKWGVWTALALVLALAPWRGYAQTGQKTRLLEWGFDQPDTAYIRKNISAMEQSPFDGTPTPFDGVVLAAQNGSGQLLHTLFWTGVSFQQSDFQSAVNDLQATTFHYLTNNFLRVNIQNAPWFDDTYWNTILNNAGIVAWICQQGGLKGIALDTEQYNYAYHATTKTYSGAYLFCYRAVALDEQALTGRSHSFEEYVAQVRRRGYAFGKALTASYPQMAILITHSSSEITRTVTVDANKQVAIQPHGFNTPLQWSPVGLFPAFLDGMLEGARRSAEIVDLQEAAYPLRADDSTSTQFDRLASGVSAARHYSQTPQLYASRLSFGFGLWMNYQELYSDGQGMRLRFGWDPQNTDNNYFTPNAFRQALEAALSTTNHYVFIYTESGYQVDASGHIVYDAQGNPVRTPVSWWTGGGLSQDYVSQVQKAHPH
ncbi:MAG TPA: hypothetical protein VKU00_17440 [Chthonomonadaceae bacterium]|nr:hypothetical protein [Chthonomonadaceae bacterium]